MLLHHCHTFEFSKGKYVVQKVLVLSESFTKRWLGIRGVYVNSSIIDEEALIKWVLYKVEG
jgi:hypothetical protein